MASMANVASAINEDAWGLKLGCCESHLELMPGCLKGLASDYRFYLREKRILNAIRVSLVLCALCLVGSYICTDNDLTRAAAVLSIWFYFLFLWVLILTLIKKPSGGGDGSDDYFEPLRIFTEAVNTIEGVLDVTLAQMTANDVFVDRTSDYYAELWKKGHRRLHDLAKSVDLSRSWSKFRATEEGVECFGPQDDDTVDDNGLMTDFVKVFGAFRAVDFTEGPMDHFLGGEEPDKESQVTLAS